ncbi:hypothetical protein HDU98_009376 [Podochytrium sp. JEL0797]|nr:hypothetical protein HDU98_009376 [Podochytrium sp. JEL0797]
MRANTRHFAAPSDASASPPALAAFLRSPSLGDALPLVAPQDEVAVVVGAGRKRKASELPPPPQQQLPSEPRLHPQKRRPSNTTAANKNFEFGSRLIAHSHSQITKLLLQLVERRTAAGDLDFQSDLMLLLPPKVDYSAIESEIKDSLATLTKFLPPLRTTVTPQTPSPRDSTWFRKCSGALSHLRNCMSKHSQNLLDGQMYRDYIVFFAPLALETADAVPVWDDPRNNKLAQGVWKKVAAGLKVAVWKCSVVDVKGREEVRGGGVASLPSSSSAASLSSAQSSALPSPVSPAPLDLPPSAIDGSPQPQPQLLVPALQSQVRKSELEQLVRVVKACHGFSSEIQEFRGVLEAVECALDQASIV